MSKKNRGSGELQTRGDYGVPRYSRSAGITSYRRRRRRSRLFKVVVALILVAIIGSAAVLFGRSYFDYKNLPFDIPGLPTHDDVVQTEAAVPKSPAQITVASAGDVIMNSSVIGTGLKESGAYDFDHLFSHLSHELKTFDLRTVSQETSLAGSAYGFGNISPLNAPQELGRAEVEAGFNVILRACDHTLDVGYDGIHTELYWWHSEQPNTPVLGIAEPDPIAHPGLSDYVSHVFTVVKDDFRVAILNHSVGVSDNDKSVVSSLDVEKITEDVQKARELGAEMIIACPHWGVEGSQEVTEEQMTLARLYADLGVDVIVGSHPRVLQRVEVLQNAEGHKTLCFYSLGCLISSLDANNFLGGLAEFTFARDDQGTCSVASAVLKPIVTHRAAGDQYATYFLSDYTEELAWSGWDAITPQTYSDRCAEILGEGFNRDTCELVIDMGATSAAQAETDSAEQPEEDQADEDEEQPVEEQAAEELQDASYETYDDAPNEAGDIAVEEPQVEYGEAY